MGMYRLKYLITPEGTFLIPHNCTQTLCAHTMLFTEVTHEVIKQYLHQALGIPEKTKSHNVLRK